MLFGKKVGFFGRDRGLSRLRADIVKSALLTLTGHSAINFAVLHNNARR